MKKIVRQFEKLTHDHPILLKKRGADSLCRWATVFVLAHAGGGRVVAFSVADDPRFSEHYAIFIGKNRVFDPTFAQAGGRVRRPLARLADYPRNYSVRGVYDWTEEFIGCDVDEILVRLPQVLKERASAARSDRVFWFWCGGFSGFLAVLPVVARIWAGGF